MSASGRLQTYLDVCSRPKAPVDPGKHRLPGLLRDLELNGPTGLTLHDNRAVKDASSLRDVLDTETDRVTAAESAKLARKAYVAWLSASGDDVLGVNGLGGGE